MWVLDNSLKLFFLHVNIVVKTIPYILYPTICFIVASLPVLISGSIVSLEMNTYLGWRLLSKSKCSEFIYIGNTELSENRSVLGQKALSVQKRAGWFCRVIPSSVYIQDRILICQWQLHTPKFLWPPAV